MAHPRDQVLAEERPRWSPWLLAATALWVVLGLVLVLVPGRIPVSTLVLVVPGANLAWLGTLLAQAARVRYVLTPARLEIRVGGTAALALDVDRLDRVVPAGRMVQRAVRQEFNLSAVPSHPLYAGGRAWLVVGRTGGAGRAAAVFYPSPAFVAALAGAARARGRRGVVADPGSAS